MKITINNISNNKEIKGNITKWDMRIQWEMQWEHLEIRGNGDQENGD